MYLNYIKKRFISPCGELAQYIVRGRASHFEYPAFACIIMNLECH